MPFKFFTIRVKADIVEQTAGRLLADEPVHKVSAEVGRSDACAIDKVSNKC